MWSSPALFTAPVDTLYLCISSPTQGHLPIWRFWTILIIRRMTRPDYTQQCLIPTTTTITTTPPPPPLCFSTLLFSLLSVKFFRTLSISHSLFAFVFPWRIISRKRWTCSHPFQGNMFSYFLFTPKIQLYWGDDILNALHALPPSMARYDSFAL